MTPCHPHSFGVTCSCFTLLPLLPRCMFCPDSGMLCLTLILSLPPPAAWCAPLLLLACVLALPAPHLTRTVRRESPFDQPVLNNTKSARNMLVNGGYMEGLHLCQQDTARTTPERAVREGIFQTPSNPRVSRAPASLKRDTCPFLKYLVSAGVGPCSHGPFCSCVDVEKSRGFALILSQCQGRPSPHIPCPAGGR